MSRVGLSTPFYTPKPVGKTAKTSFFSRRAITACSSSFFSLIPSNFTSHTRCMISAILYSFVTTISRAPKLIKAISMTYLSSIRGQPIKILRHQSAGHSNRCMKPVQSLFMLARRCCFEFFPPDFRAKERLLAVYDLWGRQCDWIWSAGN